MKNWQKLLLEHLQNTYKFASEVYMSSDAGSRLEIAANEFENKTRDLYEILEEEFNKD